MKRIIVIVVLCAVFIWLSALGVGLCRRTDNTNTTYVVMRNEYVVETNGIFVAGGYVGVPVSSHPNREAADFVYRHHKHILNYSSIYVEKRVSTPTVITRIEQ